MAGTRKLAIEIIGDEKSAVRAFNRTGAAAQGLGAKFAGVAGRVAKTAALVTGAAALGGLALTLKAGAGEWMQHAKVAAQTEAALKSTGNAANVTKGHIEALAKAQMLKTGIDDELIQSGQNLLLTFKNVRNEVGEGNKIFDRATVAALDLSQAGFGSIESASKMLGKALNDPVKGMTAMSRAGVTFSDSQKKTIKALVASGKSLEAQKLILKEVESQVGGSAAAFGKTLPGQIAILKQSFSNLAGELVGGLMPSLTKAVGIASKFVSEFSQAKGWRAKLNIVWTGLRGVATDLFARLRSVVSSIFSTTRRVALPMGDFIEIKDAGFAQKFAERLGGAIKTAFVGGTKKVALPGGDFIEIDTLGIAERMQQQFLGIDWGGVGSSVGDGIASAVATAAGPGKALSGAVANLARSIDWVQFGRAAGPGLAAAMVTAFATLLDPVFWAKNWDLALAIGLVVFGRGLGRLAAPLGRAIASTLGRAWESGVLAIVSTIERLSPRIASAVLAALLKLPGLVTSLLGRVTSIVSTQFDKLGRIAQFVVKVLGIQAAVNAVAAFAGKVNEWLTKVDGWFKSLPGKIKDAFPNPGAILSGIGAAIISGLWGGLQSKWREVAGWLGGLGGQIKGLKGPMTKDAVLLRDEGAAIIRGLGQGMQAEWVRVASFLRGLAAASVKEINALQAQLNAINARREAQDRAAAVRSAEAALAEARKKKEGVAAAEQALARAREDIVVAGLNRQLAKEQALYDKRQSMIQARMDKLNAVLQRAQDKAASMFDRMQSKIMRAFEATRGGMTPAEQALAAISDRRRQEDLTRAVDDAQKSLSEAMKGDDPDAIVSAQRALARAQEDVQVASLERQAAAERTAMDQQTESMREKLEAKLATMATAWKGGTAAIVTLLEGYGIDFANVGSLLGEAFRESLIASIKGAGNAAKAAASAKANVAAAARTKPLRVPHMATGGHILSDGLAFLHRGETVTPNGGARAVSGGVTNVWNISLPNYLGDKREVTEMLRSEFIKIGRRNPGIFGGLA